MKSNNQLLATAALDLIKTLKVKKATRINSAVELWNICVEQAGLTGTYDFPVNSYTRKAHLMADLVRCAEQLEAPQEFTSCCEIEAAAIEVAHAEALEIDTAVDAMIDEREHVSNCSYEGFQEQARINQIGMGCALNLPARLGVTFALVRKLALRLWEAGFVTYPPEECGAEYVAACVECRTQWVWNGWQ